jgi:hypothetical protein
MDGSAIYWKSATAGDLPRCSFEKKEKVIEGHRHQLWYPGAQWERIPWD